MMIKELHRVVDATLESRPESIDSPQDYATAEKFLMKCDRTSNIVRAAFRSDVATAERKKEAAATMIRILEDKIRSLTSRLDQASKTTKQMIQTCQIEEPGASAPLSTGVTP